MAYPILPILQGLGTFLYLSLYLIYSYIHTLFRFLIPTPLKSLDGEIFLITGSSSGIGRSVVLNLAKYHPSTILVLWDINHALNLKTGEEAKALGASHVHVYQVDVTDKEQVRNVAKKVQEEVGDVSTLFNNAGIAAGPQFFSASEEELEKTINVNLVSHFWTLRAFVPKMMEKNRGHIVTTGSMGSFFGLRICYPYFAAKFGIRGLCESLQDEFNYLNLDNIKITTIYPGFVETPLTSNTTVAVGVGSKKGYLKPDFVAEKIVQGIQKNEEKVVVPRAIELLIFGRGLMPSKFYWKMRTYLVDNNRQKKTQ